MISFSIIQKSQLEGALRLDAEYYQPEYLELEKDLEKFSKKLKTFNDLLENGNSLTGGATPFGADYQDQGIKFLRVQNIMPGYLDFSDIVFIDRNLHEGQLKRSKLINRDVLLTITGVSYGKSAVYKSVFGEVNINQHSVRIYFKNELIPEYVAMFLNSKYGRFQSDRKVTGNTRPALAYEEIRDYKIPLLSKKKQQQIEFLYNESLILDGKSTELYRQAEDLLLKELGLKDFEPEDNLSYVVNFSNTELANRLDSEYFQPKYEKIKLKIKEFEFKELGSIVLIKKGIEPGSEAYQEDGIPFIRVSNISKFGIKDNNQQYLSQEVYDKFKDNFEPKIGEVLLTKDATPGIAYYLDSQIERIISGGILRLKPKIEIEPEYLSLVINSIIGQMQAERDTGGSIIVHWRPEQIKNILIPILPKHTQQKIADLICQSHAARKKAKQLLEEAKQKVEDFIEKG